MKSYREPSKDLYSGRNSSEKLYLHEKISCLSLADLSDSNTKSFSILGYSCDEGVKRNSGRIGAAKGPDAIRKQLGKLPNHLSHESKIYDTGTFCCTNGDMEKTQSNLSKVISQILSTGSFPLILGGGHDMAYGTYNGIQQYVKGSSSIGIINFDAHFDLRSIDVDKPSNSGTPFYQIAQDCHQNQTPFHYLCLGVRSDANDKTLYDTAKGLGVQFIERDTFRIEFHNEINAWINAFINNVDHIYVTIDLDGFSSAYAPGVSAASPMGFTPDVVLESLKTIMGSGKLRILDIAELNPDFDIDNQTAKLAASLMHYVIHNLP